MRASLSRMWVAYCGCGQRFETEGGRKLDDVTAELVAEGWTRYSLGGRGPWTCLGCSGEATDGEAAPGVEP